MDGLCTKHEWNYDLMLPLRLTISYREHLRIQPVTTSSVVNSKEHFAQKNIHWSILHILLGPKFTCRTSVAVHLPDYHVAGTGTSINYEYTGRHNDYESNSTSAYDFVIAAPKSISANTYRTAGDQTANTHASNQSSYLKTSGSAHMQPLADFSCAV